MLPVTTLQIPYFPTDLKQQLKALAARQGITLREATVRAVTQYLESTQNVR